MRIGPHTVPSLRLRSLWASFHDLPSSPDPNVVSRHDLTPMSILVKANVSLGVLDTGSCGPTDLVLNLVALWHMLGREHREVVRRILKVEEIEWKRGVAWAAEQAMGWVWHYQQSNAVMTAPRKITLQKTIEDDGPNLIRGGRFERRIISTSAHHLTLLV